MIMSCSDNSTPAAPFTGWAIGWSEDAGNFSVKILKTDNGGATWALQVLPAGCEGFQGNDISAVNHRVAWAAMSLNKGAAIDGGILHTADGGASWTIQTLPDGMTNRQIKKHQRRKSNGGLGSKYWRRCPAHHRRWCKLEHCRSKRR